MSDKEFDFIVVGAGPAGSAISARLAATPSRPTVLLVEAGGANEGLAHLSGAERFAVAFRPDSPLNWSYKTVPQHPAGGSGGEHPPIDYSRGKGLGGSTAINFCGWVVGPDDDYDEWARLVGDDKFGWANVKRVLRDKVERFHDDVPSAYRKSFRPRSEDHGTTGVVDVSYQDDWFDMCDDVFTAAEQTPGFGRVNPDVNNGDPMGMGIGPLCVYRGRRITSASAYGLDQPLPQPANLTIVTGELIDKIVIEDGTAVAIRAAGSGKVWRASKEIIICAGAINTPQLLLLSGIGPRNEVVRHGIELVCELPHVGQNLQDHCFSTAGIVVKKKPGQEGKQRGPKKFPSPMGWFKLPAVHTSAEFEQLDPETQDFLKRPHVPNWEIAALTPFFDGEPMGEDEEVFSSMALIMNPQSRGTVTLQSADPHKSPLIDPKFLTHPYDRRNAIESLREMLRYQQAPAWQARAVVRTVGGWPAGSTYDTCADDMADEALWDAVKSRIGSSWHMAGTCRMGPDRAGWEDACVDPAFRVFGVRNLRVADMSVVPRINSNHTQTTAYIIGELAAEQLINEHGLAQPAESRRVV